MIKSVFSSLALMILLTVLQTTWLNAIAIGTVIPDLALIALIYVSFKNSQPIGQVSGFLSGFFTDSVSAVPLGTTSLIRTLIALSYNLFAGKFYIDRLLMPFLFVLAGSLLKALYTEILQLFFASHLMLSYSFFSRTLWIEVAYNAVLAPVLFFIFGLFDRLLLVRERRA